MNFYDFETMELVCTSDKTTASISTLAFDITGSSLACLSGETCRNITWEPSSILDAWVCIFFVVKWTIVKVRIMNYRRLHLVRWAQ